MGSTIISQESKNGKQIFIYTILVKDFRSPNIIMDMFAYLQLDNKILKCQQWFRLKNNSYVIKNQSCHKLSVVINFYNGG